MTQSVYTDKFHGNGRTVSEEKLMVRGYYLL